MTKKELLELMSKDAGITKSQAEKALAVFLNSTKKTLQEGQRVSLVGFGTFSVVKRGARVAKNPQNGKEIKVAAKKVTKFKASKSLQTVVK